MHNRNTPPYRLSPAAWELGARDHELAVELHDMGCDEPGYEELQDELRDILERLSRMTGPELRAYIDGMHFSMGEYFC